ncbi:MAG: hypothetical protein ACOYLK_14710 [Sphingomonas sp.]
MATVSAIIDRALKRAGVLDAGENASGADLADALTALNEIMRGWKGENVDIAHQDFVAADTFVWFVPPADMKSAVLADLSYQGAWNASTNTPTLASATGTSGYLYKVSVAGSTTLDDVTSWSLNDFAIYDGTEWLKGQSSTTYDGAVVAILAMRVLEDFGGTPGPILSRDADMGWRRIMAQFVRPDVAIFDSALLRVPSKRYYDGG